MAALLLTPLAITSPAPAAMPSSSQAETLRVQREYGDGPVTIPPGVERLRLTFHGREGNKVALIESATLYDPCGKVSLRGPSGKVAAVARGRLEPSGSRTLLVRRHPLRGRRTRPLPS